MARKTKDEAAETRASILEASITIFLLHGVSRSTLDHIAKEANCTRGAVYHHFANKADIVRELLDSVRLPFEELLSLAEESPIEDPLRNIQHCIYEGFRLILEDERRRRIHTIFFHRCEFVADLNPALEAELGIVVARHKRFTALFKKASDLGFMRPDLSPEQASFLLHAYVTGIYSDWLKEPWEGFISIPIEPMLDVFFQGIRKKA